MPGAGFQFAGYGTNRFTATIKVTVPDGYTVVGSGAGTTSRATATATAAETPQPPTLKRRTRARDQRAHARRPAGFAGRPDLCLYLGQTSASQARW